MADLISRQWLMECVNEGWIKFDTEKDENRFIHLVRDIAPSAQPETHEERTETHACDCIERQAAIDAIRASTKKYTGFMEMEMYTDDDAVEAIISLPSAQPEAIVYCGECVHMMPNGRCRQFADESIRPSASDYCSAGERRTDERSD